MATREVDRGTAVDQGETDVPAAKPGIFTTEFWTTAGGMVANLFTVAVMLGWISGDDATQLHTAGVALIGAFQAILVNGAIVWAYIQSRTKAKAAIVEANSALQLKRLELRQLEYRLQLQAAPPAPCAPPAQ